MRYECAHFVHVWDSYIKYWNLTSLSNYHNSCIDISSHQSIRKKITMDLTNSISPPIINKPGAEIYNIKDYHNENNNMIHHEIEIIDDQTNNDNEDNYKNMNSKDKKNKDYKIYHIYEEVNNQFTQLSIEEQKNHQTSEKRFPNKTTKSISHS